MTERTLNDMHSAIRGEPLSQVGAERKADYLKGRLLDVNRTVMGQMTEEEAGQTASKFLEELGDTFPGSLTLDDLGVMVRAGMLGELIGNTRRPTPANMLAWLDKYMNSPERKREFIELQNSRKWVKEHKDELTKEDVNERDFDVVGAELADIWDAYVRNGCLEKYRETRDAKQFFQMMVHSACYRWLKVAGLVSDDAETLRREERCMREGNKLKRGFEHLARNLATALMLEWTFTDAVKSGRDLGSEIRRELESWSTQRKRSTKRVTTFADGTWW